MVLLQVFSRIKRAISTQPSVLHVHHLASESRAQSQFRDDAYFAVQRWAGEAGFSFLSNKGTLDFKPESNSEGGLREFRKKVILELTGGPRQALPVTAHHLNDQVETQVHRLIRGTGARGIRAMTVYNKEVFRPFLEIERATIAQYASHFGVKFIEDPSNRQTAAFRNWLRLEWLPQLERRSPGSMRSLERSFRKWSESAKVSYLLQEQSVQSSANASGCVQAEAFFAWESELQRYRIYEWLNLSRGSQIQHSKQVTASQVEEVLKQLKAAFLDKSRKEHSFKSGGVIWIVTSRHILFRPDKGPDLTVSHEGIVFTS